MTVIASPVPNGATYFGHPSGSRFGGKGAWQSQVGGFLVFIRIIILVVLSLIQFSCTSLDTVQGPTEKIELHGGQTLVDTVKGYQSSVFTLERTGQVPREQVKKIVFIDSKTSTQPDKAKIVPSDIQALLKQAETATQKYPNANGIIILDDGQYTLKSDGTNQYRYHFIGRILTNKAKPWASRTLWLQEERSRANVVMGRTIKPNGEVVELDPAEIKISKPAREMAFFGRGKIKSFTLPDVGLGCLIEYIIEYDTFNPWDKHIYEAGFMFQDKDPVLYSKVAITIPADKELNYCYRNMTEQEAKPEIIKGEGIVTYVWVMKDVPPIIEEPAMPSLADVVPRISTCLFKDWDYIFERGSKMLLPRMQVTPEIEELVAELTKDARTIEEKIAALYYFAQREIRYISIKGSISSGRGGHPAYETLQNKYGDCIDKAVLFSTMLKVIDVESYPISVRTNNEGTAIRDIPSLDCNHAFNEIHLDGKIFYLDPVTRNYRYPYFAGMDHGITAVNEITGQVNFIKVPPPDHNLNAYKTELTVKANGDTQGKTIGDYTGDYEAGLRGYWERVPESQRKYGFQQMVNRLSPGARLIGFELTNLLDISQPFQLMYQYALPQCAVVAGDLMILGIPGLDYYCNEVALEERTYNLEYATSRQTKHDVTISIPDGYKVKYLPEAVKFECLPYASYEAVYQQSADTAGTILFNDNFKRFERIVPVKDYAKYKKFLQQVSKSAKEKIFLVKEE